MSVEASGESGELYSRTQHMGPLFIGPLWRRVSGGTEEEADTAGGAAQKKPLSVCPHQRIRSRCKECGGASICPHQRERSTCKECGGASICQHQRIRRHCKECGGVGICQHRAKGAQARSAGGEHLVFL